MNNFKEFLEILKLPPSILSALMIVSGLILILPDDVIKKLYMFEFRNNYGFAISIIFLVSLAILVVLIIMWSARKIIEKIKYKKLKEKRTKYLLELDNEKTQLINQFVKEKEHTLSLATNSGITVELSSYGLISPAGSTKLVTFGDIFTGDENTMYINYFLQPWVISLIKENEELKKKFKLQ